MGEDGRVEQGDRTDGIAGMVTHTSSVSRAAGGGPCCAEASSHRGAGEQRLLHGILGVLEWAEHPVAVHRKFSPSPSGQRAWGGAVRLS